VQGHCNWKSVVVGGRYKVGRIRAHVGLMWLLRVLPRLLLQERRGEGVRASNNIQAAPKTAAGRAGHKTRKQHNAQNA